MNAVSKKTVTLADTEETIDGLTVLGDYHMNGGYDWMELIEEHGWAVLSSWGCDGWDLGQWPYVMVAVTRTADSIGNLFGIAAYCEGDVTCYWCKCAIRSVHYWNSSRCVVGGRHSTIGRRCRPSPLLPAFPGR